MTRAGLAATAVLAGALGVPGTGAVAVAAPCPVRTTGALTVIPLPAYPEAGVTRAFRIDPADPRRIYATNGSTLMATTDGGCRWQRRWSLATPAADAPRETIVAVEGPTAHNPNTLSLVTQTPLFYNLLGVHVLRSDDAGAHFTAADSGLPAAVSGAPNDVTLRVAPTDSRTLYLATPYGVFGTDDGGGSWEQRGDPAHPVLPDWSAPLAVDALDAAEVWTAGRLAEDAPAEGVTGFGAALQLPGGARRIGHRLDRSVRSLVSAPVSAKASILFAYGENSVFESRDRGATFRMLPYVVPGASVTAVAARPGGDVAILLASGSYPGQLFTDLYRYDRTLERRGRNAWVRAARWPQTSSAFAVSRLQAVGRALYVLRSGDESVRMPSGGYGQGPSPEQLVRWSGP